FEFFQINRGLFDVVLDAFAEAGLLFGRHRAPGLGGNTQRQHSGGHFGVFGHQRSGGHHGAFADASPVEYDGADANQRFIFHGAAVQHRQVSHRYTVADRERNAGIAVQHGAVLDAGLRANLDAIDVAADGHMGPDAGAL